MSDQAITPYESFSTASRDIASNGGAWSTIPQLPGTTVPHQSMGGLSDLIALTGYMQSKILLPTDVAQVGDSVITALSFKACEVGTTGDTRTQAQLQGFSIPFCPTMSGTLTLSGGVPYPLQANPVVTDLITENVGTTRTTVYVGDFQYSVMLFALGLHPDPSSSPGSNGSGNSGSTVGNSNPTQSSSATALTVSSTSGIVNGTQSGVGSSTNTNGGTTAAPLLLTTKDAPQSGSGSLSLSPNTGSQSSAENVNDGRMSRTAAIIGSVLGVFAFLAIILFMVVLKLRRRKMEKKRQMVKEKENGERLETSAAEGSVVEAASESSRSNLFSSFSPFDDPHYDSPVTSYSNPNPNSNPNSNSINPRTSLSLAVPPRPQQAASTNLPSYTEPPSYTHSAPPPLNPENQTQPQSLQQQPPAPQPHLADLSGPLDAIWLLSYANGLRQQDRR